MDDSSGTRARTAGPSGSGALGRGTCGLISKQEQPACSTWICATREHQRHPPRSRAAVRRRAEHPEDEVAALAQHGVLAVDLAQRAQQRGVARAREAAGDDLAPAAVPAVLALLLPRVRG